MKELKDVYQKNKLIIDLIGTNKELQNDLRMTDIKRYSMVIEQAYDDIINNEKGIVSCNDLTRALYELKNSKQWEITLNYY